MSNNKRVWLTWENQRRNLSMSAALSAELIQYEIRKSRSVRYLISSYKTVMSLVIKKPEIIFVQNPSIILSTITAIYGRIFKIPVIMDVHNAGAFPMNGKKRWANAWAIMLFRLVKLNIVTNEGLANYVRRNGGNTIIMPDPIPLFHDIQSRKVLSGLNNIAFICTWADDEPYAAVISAAKLLDKNTYIYITGNSKGRESEIGFNIPSNVMLTGYLPENEFIQLLHSCDGIMDLTTREDCLVCGAYEALAIGKPLIVSDTKTLRKYFSEGTIYTKNDAVSISQAIKDVILNKYKCKEEIVDLRKKKNIEWIKCKTELEMRLLEFSK